MSTYYADDSVTLWHGDALETLTGMPAGSVDCIVTSPPYFGLRDYGVDGQLGLESSPAEYVAAIRGVFTEARRVLASDGTLWLNLGDSYAASSAGVPAKNLLGTPWRVAFALQDDGWILRNAIIWHKPNAMPSNVTDRLSCRYEQVFMFSKRARYWFDLDPIREKPVTTRESALSWARDSKEADLPGRVGNRQHRASRERNRGGRTDGFTTPTESGGVGTHPKGRNPGDMWSIVTQPFPEAHFACMPVTLAERCIKAGCKPGGTVLDPFSGSGTTGLAAAKLGRRYVGIDLNAKYLDMSLKTRLSQVAL